MFEKEKETLSVQLRKNAVIMYYSGKDTVYVQRKSAFDRADVEKAIITMIEKIEEKTGLSNPEKVHTYITLPHSMVRTTAMLNITSLSGLKGNKLEDALKLFTENSLDTQSENPIYYFSFLERDYMINDDYMTVSVVNEEEISFLPELLFERNFRLRSIEPESESIRRYAVSKGAIQDEGKNAIIHFFYDGEEMNVGFYIYKDDFLCGHRYLPLDVYKHADLSNELAAVLSDCKEKLKVFNIDTYCVISERETDFELLKPYFDKDRMKFIHSKYATNEGAILLLDNKKNTKKRGDK